METITYKIKVCTKRPREEDSVSDRPLKKQRQAVKISIPADHSLTCSTDADNCLNIAVIQPKAIEVPVNNSRSSPPTSPISSSSSDYFEVDPNLTQVLPRPSLVLGHCNCCPQTHTAHLRDPDSGICFCKDCQNNYRVQLSDLVELQLIAPKDQILLAHGNWRLTVGENGGVFDSNGKYYRCIGQWMHETSTWDFNVELAEAVILPAHGPMQKLAELVFDYQELLENHFYNRI